MPITLTALPSASQRTKNRIREHGPVFKVRQWSMSVNAMDGRVAFCGDVLEVVGRSVVQDQDFID